MPSIPFHLKNDEPKKQGVEPKKLSHGNSGVKIPTRAVSDLKNPERSKNQAKNQGSVLLAQIARLDDPHRKCIVINVGATLFSVLVVNGWVQTAKNVYPIERLPELDSIIIHEVDKCLSTPKIPI